MSNKVSPMLTDLYQITMAQAYFLNERHNLQASFSLSFRENPFKGGYIIASGIEEALDFLDNFKFSDSDITYLASQKASDGTELFKQDFLEHLRALQFTCDVECVSEGSLVFPREPIFKVTGPIEQCQLVETAVLNLINFSSLVATKAMRCVLAAKGDRLLEFGLRRAQGPDGGVTASKASFVGGFHATSNVLAGMTYDIPVAGTHAHSWVMSFGDELESFRAYAESSPNNVVLLVDTYDSIKGIEKAIIVGHEMRARGEILTGIRLDSGDLAWLSIKAREMLDEAGLNEVKIFATNELDEYTIESLKLQGAKIDVWGVGTKLATAYDQPAMGGVYKLSAMQNAQGEWEPRIKFSEQLYKMTFPGIHQVRRYFDASGRPLGDMIFDPSVATPSRDTWMIDPFDVTRRKSFQDAERYEDLLTLKIKAGKRTVPHEPLIHARERACASIATLDATQTRHLNPHSYPVGIEQNLEERRRELIIKLRENLQYS